jgi:uncharacterized protein
LDVPNLNTFVWPSQPKVVVDTNVLLSAALSPAGAPTALLAWLLIHASLVLSKAAFDELQTRIFRPKFDRYLSLDTRKRILHDVSAAAFWVDVPSNKVLQRFCRDPDDDVFIHTAMAAGACAIVSGDADLLVLDPIGALRILNPRLALDSILKQ